MDNFFLLFNSVIVFISMAMLWKGAEVLVESASQIAASFKISDLVIGLTVVAVGTSAPEFAVTISAALMGKDSISIGNVVGSNIFNLGLILGGTALIREIKTSKKLVYRDGLFLFGVTILLYVILFGFSLSPKPTSYSLELQNPNSWSIESKEIITEELKTDFPNLPNKFYNQINNSVENENIKLPNIYYDENKVDSILKKINISSPNDYHIISKIENVGFLNGIDGILMLIILISYLIYLFIKKETLDEEDISHDPISLKHWILLLIGICTVVFGGHLLVDGASNVARFLGISEWVIAVTIVAAGTSAPEFATSIMAAWKGKHGMAIGNLFGSDLFNILGVLGVAGLINPTMVTMEVHGSIAMLVGQVALVLILMRSGWRITRLEGGLLLALNIFRWYLDFS
ncbi:MAG: conjugal transfer protein TraR [Candidatus Marinimicrobia bacterium]|nr:conjugal transfer protein TraR [Candidatus Neomarinimicrobiota bacterium]